LYKEVPAFRPVIDRLPPPGPETFSCRIHGVCSEWANGWMPFWIRDEAYRAGLTPSLPEAQRYFQEIWSEIELACRTGKFSCSRRGQGLVAPMELRWTRAYVLEAWRLAKMALAPDPHTVTVPPLIYIAPPEVVRMFQATTMTEKTATEWHPVAGEESAPTSLRGTMRRFLANALRLLDMLLLLGGLAALVARLWQSDRQPLNTVETIATILALYSFLRFAALTYVAVYLGTFDPRIAFASYTAGLFFAVPLLAVALARAADMKRKS
jgi:hypothetical protein